MIRPKCRRNGHRWVAYINGGVMPFQPCRRWFCTVWRESPALRAALKGDTDDGPMACFEWCNRYMKPHRGSCERPSDAALKEGT